MAERIALGIEQGLDARAVGAGAEGGELRLAVQVQQAIQLRQREREHRPGTRQRIDVAGHRGAATIGNHGQVMLAGVVQQHADLG